MYMPPIASKSPTHEPHVLEATALATQKTTRGQAQSYRLLILPHEPAEKIGPQGFSQRNMQLIIQPECPVAIGALPRSRQSSLLDALVTEDVPAGLDDSILKVLLAHGTNGHYLAKVSGGGKQGTQLIHSPEAFHTRCFDCLNPCSSTIPGSSLFPPAAL